MSRLYFPLHCRYVYFTKLHFIICLFFQFCLINLKYYTALSSLHCPKQWHPICKMPCVCLAINNIYASIALSRKDFKMCIDFPWSRLSWDNLSHKPSAILQVLHSFLSAVVITGTLTFPGILFSEVFSFLSMLKEWDFVKVI